MRLRLVYAVAAVTAGGLPVPVASPPVGEPGSYAARAQEEAVPFGPALGGDPAALRSLAGEAFPDLRSPTDGGRSDREVRCAGGQMLPETGARIMVVGGGCREAESIDASVTPADSRGALDPESDPPARSAAVEPVPMSIPELFGAAVLGGAALDGAALDGAATCALDACREPTVAIGPTPPSALDGELPLPIVEAVAPIDELLASMPAAGSIGPAFAADVSEPASGEDDRRFAPPSAVPEPPALAAPIAVLAGVVGRRRRKRRAP